MSFWILVNGTSIDIVDIQLPIFNLQDKLYDPELYSASLTLQVIKD
jgi:hypothetical protein